jgi:uncharacterized damage-inducible protein DinB
VDEFERDRTETQLGLEDARTKLLAIVKGLRDSDLRRGRRGGWDIGTVIQHTVDSEWHYAAMAQRLRGNAGEPPSRTPSSIESVPGALTALAEARGALEASVSGVTEEQFYQLGGGGQEYSILSILQNVAQHDAEHGAQIAHLHATAAQA